MKVADLQEVKLQPRIGIIGEAHLKLPDVIERVPANDPDLRVARISRDEAGYQIKAVLGAYDPIFGIQACRTRAVSPVASILGGSWNGRLTQTELAFTP